MASADGRPGRQVGPLQEKTVHALLTKQRIHALVGLVIDELERRRAKGKGDYVAKLADEVEKGGIGAWRALRELLPRDDVASNERPSLSIGNVFLAAAIEASKRGKEASSVIDATAELVPVPLPNAVAEPPMGVAGGGLVPVPSPNATVEHTAAMTPEVAPVPASDEEIDW